jgi:hypothetical protein
MNIFQLMPGFWAWILKILYQISHFILNFKKKSYFYEHTLNYNLTEKISFHGLHNIKKNYIKKINNNLKKKFFELFYLYIYNKNLELLKKKKQFSKYFVHKIMHYLKIH